MICDYQFADSVSCKYTPSSGNGGFPAKVTVKQTLVRQYHKASFVQGCSCILQLSPPVLDGK
jgi:hypothetical protein